MAKRNFYKKSGESKKVLKKVIRPTHKKISAKNPEESVILSKKVDTHSIDRKEFESSDLRSLLVSPPDLDTIRHSLKKNDDMPNFDRTQIVVPHETENSFEDDSNNYDEEVFSPSSEESENLDFQDLNTSVSVEKVAEPQSDTSSNGVETQSQIDEIQRIIQQASTRLQDLEKKKKEEEEERAKAAENVVVEKFDGVSDSSEEIALIKEELAHYQTENKRLHHELNLMKDDFSKEKTLLEKTVKELQKKSHSKNPVEDNTFFSFSDQLKEALDTIDTLNDPNFKPQYAEVVLTPMSNVEISNQTKVEPKKLNLTMPKVIKVDEEPEVKAKEPILEEKVEEEPVQKPKETLEKKESSPKAKKNKRMLITGGTVAALVLVGSLVGFQSISQPKVDQALVDEYLSQNESKVLGVQTRKAAVPDGIVADKNSEATLSETEWAEYRDPSFAMKIDYPANVTERLHTSNAITFLRKDSYIFKVTKVSYEGTLEEYWESVRDSGFKYEATPDKFKNREMLHLQLLENVEYPGEKYLVATDTAIYDIWFASDPTIYGEDDIARAQKMLESINFL